MEPEDAVVSAGTSISSAGATAASVFSSPSDYCTTGVSSQTILGFSIMWEDRVGRIVLRYLLLRQG